MNPLKLFRERRASYSQEDQTQNDMIEYSFEDFSEYRKKPKIMMGNKQAKNKIIKSEECRMDNCFDFAICRRNGFKETVTHTLRVLLILQIYRTDIELSIELMKGIRLSDG